MVYCWQLSWSVPWNHCNVHGANQSGAFMKKRVWKHNAPSKKGKKFKGRYSWDGGERRFELVELSVMKKPRVISFESWQMAKALGWRLS